jgi:hypothetical protein
LCAAFHSREFHPAHLARDCGVSQPTIKVWSKILEASYLAMTLSPFFKNYGRRIIRTSKFYMTDPFSCMGLPLTEAETSTPFRLTADNTSPQALPVSTMDRPQYDATDWSLPRNGKSHIRQSTKIDFYHPTQPTILFRHVFHDPTLFFLS